VEYVEVMPDKYFNAKKKKVHQDTVEYVEVMPDNTSMYEKVLK
jgi:hypothetical protein